MIEMRRYLIVILVGAVCLLLLGLGGALYCNGACPSWIGSVFLIGAMIDFALILIGLVTLGWEELKWWHSPKRDSLGAELKKHWVGVVLAIVIVIALWGLSTPDTYNDTFYGFVTVVLGWITIICIVVFVGELIKALQRRSKRKAKAGKKSN